MLMSLNTKLQDHFSCKGFKGQSLRATTVLKLWATETGGGFVFTFAMLRASQFDCHFLPPHLPLIDAQHGYCGMVAIPTRSWRDST